MQPVVVIPMGGGRETAFETAWAASTRATACASGTSARARPSTSAISAAARGVRP
jgi:hypothetical protein